MKIEGVSLKTRLEIYSTKGSMSKANSIFDSFKGDKVIWAIVALLAVLSFSPVFSASSNLAYIKGDGNTIKFLVKHFMHLVLGFAVLYGVHKIPYHYFKGLTSVLFPIVGVLLVVTLFQGSTIDGANASRWIRIPFVGIGFQTSTLAAVVLMVYVAKYLARINGQAITFKESILPLWVPVGIVLMLILPANFSTTALIFSMVITLVFLGGYPLKYIGGVLLTGLVVLMFFVLLAKAFPGLFPNRVDTWISRIENYSNPEVDKDADYQIERAKIAIASGGVFGLGPGKSVMKNFLPQSSSDFIYAIIVEEWGLAGGIFVMLLYMFLLYRIVIVAHKTDDFFGRLVVVGVGIPIVFQALINMAVAVELFPVTGQTLPLISSGGTSIWMTCLAIGVILSVSANIAPPQPKAEDEVNPLDILSETL